MPSAELFLRLLEERDLVSPQVLQAARREFPQSSPPPDAIHVSLWLVQGHHITANQAERLLAAAAEKAEVSGAKPQAADVSQPKAVEPQSAASRVGRLGASTPPPKAPGPQVPASQAGKPDVRKPPPKAPEPKRPAAAEDDFELAPLAEEAVNKPAANKPAASEPAKPSLPAKDAKPATPGLPMAKAIGGDKKSPAGGKIGAELESLETTMKGPLDSLIESEVLEGGALDDPMGGPELNQPVSKKFKLRRFLRNLFRRKKSNTVRVKAADPKQVKVVLISWGIAVFVLLGLLTAFWFFGTSKEYLKNAEEAVAAEDYGKAIADYDEYLKRYPNVANSDEVRLQRGLAELLQAEVRATASGDWTPAFEVAKQEVKSLPKDIPASALMEKFGIALGKIGEGLAQQMQAHPDAESVNRVAIVFNLLDSGIPQKNRPDKMLDDIREMLARGRLEVESQRDLKQAVTAIGIAAQDDDEKAAYAAYHDLVKTYPGLSDNERLADAMKPVSETQQKLVKLALQTLSAVHDERPSGLLAAMPLAVQPLKGRLPEGQGKRFFAVEQGTAFGLDAATGNVLWRRFVALDADLHAVTALPVPGVDAGKAGSDVVLCDRVHKELLRVNGTTGELLWRLVVKQPIVAEPARAGKWLLLLTKDQRLTLIDLATGDASRYFHLPQAVNLPPVVDAAHGLIYLVADSSNLIVLGGALANGQCRQVLHVGHEPGTIAAPPAIVGDFLLLPVNESPGEAAIHVISISKEIEGEALKPVQTIPLAGSIDTAPVVLGHGAAVVTAQGGLFAIDRTEPGNKLAFQVVASKPELSQEKSAHYMFSAGSALWVADRQLTRYLVNADEKRISPQTTGDLGIKYMQAPLIDEGTMFQVLERTGMPGATVSAVNLGKNEAVWQTWLAAPLVAEPMLDSVSTKLTMVTASGGMFRGPLADWKPQGKTWEPVLTIDSSRLTKPLSSLLPLPGEMFAMTSGSSTAQIVIYDPKEEDKQFRWLNSPRDMSAAPGSFVGGLLTACVNGQVFLLDAGARGEMAKPLEPTPKVVPTWDWRTPVALDDKLAVLCDGDKRLTTVCIGTDEEKALILAESASATWKNRLVSPIAVLGKTVFVVDSTDSLLGFELPDLTPGSSQALGSKCAWGPKRVGKLVLVATDKGRLFAIDERQQVVWQTSLGYGPLAGVPFLSGEEMYLTSRSGVAWRISATDGKELGKVDAGCPLGTGPLVAGSRMFVGGHDGSMLEVKKP